MTSPLTLFNLRLIRPGDSVVTAAATKPSWIASFSRAQISSVVATLLDYGVLFLSTEIFHSWYVLATAWGALTGAVTNFLMNRHWSFQAAHGAIGPQARRYILVSAGSLILNTAGVFLVTEYLHFHYAVSVFVVSILIGVFFNYPLHRYYVYRL
jgi:putative flippase GtrA